MIGSFSQDIFSLSSPKKKGNGILKGTFGKCTVRFAVATHTSSEDQIISSNGSCRLEDHCVCGCVRLELAGPLFIAYIISGNYLIIYCANTGTTIKRQEAGLESNKRNGTLEPSQAVTVVHYLL